MPEALLMSAMVYGGASQMVGIELFGQHVAPWLIVLSIFAVNFRHVLYSAGIGRRIAHWPVVQQAIGLFLPHRSAIRGGRAQGGSRRDCRLRLVSGLGLPVYVFWVIESALGAVFGKLIPDTHALGLDFLLPIYFLGLVMGFRKRPLWLPVVIASAAASIIAYKTVGSPWHVSIGAVAGVLLAVVLPPHHSGVGEHGHEHDILDHHRRRGRRPISPASAAIWSSRASTTSIRASRPASTPCRRRC